MMILLKTARTEGVASLVYERVQKVAWARRSIYNKYIRSVHLLKLRLKTSSTSCVNKLLWRLTLVAKGREVFYGVEVSL